MRRKKVLKSSAAHPRLPLALRVRENTSPEPETPRTSSLETTLPMERWTESLKIHASWRNKRWEQNMPQEAPRRMDEPEMKDGRRRKPTKFASQRHDLSLLHWMWQQRPQSKEGNIIRHDTRVQNSVRYHLVYTHYCTAFPGGGCQADTFRTCDIAGLSRKCDAWNGDVRFDSRQLQRYINRISTRKLKVEVTLRGIIEFLSCLELFHAQQWRLRARAENIAAKPNTNSLK